MSQDTTNCLENHVKIAQRSTKVNDWAPDELEKQGKIKQIEKNIEEYKLELTRQLENVGGHNKRKESLDRVTTTQMTAAKPLYTSRLHKK